MYLGYGKRQNNNGNDVTFTSQVVLSGSLGPVLLVYPFWVFCPRDVGSFEFLSLTLHWILSQAWGGRVPYTTRV